MKPIVPNAAFDVIIKKINEIVDVVTKLEKMAETTSARVPSTNKLVDLDFIDCYKDKQFEGLHKHIAELQEENKKLKQEGSDFKTLLDSAAKELELLREENKSLREEILRFDSVLKDRARLVEESDKLKRSQINISNEEANRKLDGLIKMIRAWDVKGGAK